MTTLNQVVATTSSYLFSKASAINLNGSEFSVGDLGPLSCW